MDMEISQVLYLTDARTRRRSITADIRSGEHSLSIQVSLGSDNSPSQQDPRNIDYPVVYFSDLWGDDFKTRSMVLERDQIDYQVLLERHREKCKQINEPIYENKFEVDGDVSRQINSIYDFNNEEIRWGLANVHISRERAKKHFLEEGHKLEVSFPVRMWAMEFELNLQRSDSGVSCSADFRGFVHGRGHHESVLLVAEGFDFTLMDDVHCKTKEEDPVATVIRGFNCLLGGALLPSVYSLLKQNMGHIGERVVRLKANDFRP